MLPKFLRNKIIEAILFEDSHTTQLKVDGIIFRNRNSDDKIFEHTTELVGAFVLEMGN